MIKPCCRNCAHYVAKGGQRSSGYECKIRRSYKFPYKETTCKKFEARCFYGDTT